MKLIITIYRRLLPVALILLFLTCTLPTRGQVLRILPFGNSITEGTDSDPPVESERIAYRYTLYNLLTAAGYSFDFIGHKASGYDIFPDADHGGIPGTRDQYLVRLLQDGYDERWNQQITPGGQPYLDVYPPDIILLHIGTNDITHGEGASPASVAEILDEIDAWEVRTGNEVIVFVAKIINRKTYSLTTTQYNNNVAAMVAARNDSSIIMVDIENGAGIDYGVDMQDDGIHPKESGYNKMGQKWFEAIQSLNVSPYFTSTPITQATEDALYSYTVTVDDDNPNDILTLLAGSLPSWLTFVDVGNRTGVLSGTPRNEDVGSHEISLLVTDGQEIVNQDFTIEVGNVNDPPVLTGQNPIVEQEDQNFVLHIDDLILEDSDTPLADLRQIILSGVHYSFTDSTIIPEKDYNGTLVVNLKVADPYDESPEYQVNIDIEPVNDPPEIHGQPEIPEVKQSNLKTILAMDLEFTDVDNNINDLSVKILPHPDTIYAGAGNQFSVIKDTIGPLDIRIVLNDGTDDSEEYLYRVNVRPLFSPPVFTTTPPYEATVNKLYFYIVGAEDPDEGDELTYRATRLPDWLEFNSDLKLLGGNPSVEDTGLVWVGLEVSDGMFQVEQLYQLEVKLFTGNEDLQHSMTHGLIRNVYPVPARDYIQVDLSGDREFQVLITDISGRIMENRTVKMVTDPSIRIELSGYRAGVYFLRVNHGNKADSRKIVVNH